MADKIVTLAEVVKRIAVLSDVDEETAREFMQAFCVTLTDGLINGESIDIKSIGRFIEDENRPGEVKFEASLPLASVVNRPFSCFDPVELEDEPTEFEKETGDVEMPGQETVSIELPELPKLPDELSDETENDQNTDGNEVSSDEIVVVPDVPAEGVSEGKLTSVDIVEVKSDEAAPAKVQIDDTKPLQVEIVGDKKSHRKHVLSGWIFSLGLVIGICLGFVGGIFAHDSIFDSSRPEIPPVESIITEDDVESLRGELLQMKEYSTSAVPLDSIVDDTVGVGMSLDQGRDMAPESPVVVGASTQAVIDTIAPGRFLATMARKHYGSYLFWVYIYEENRDKIADPDNVAVGTVVTIPDASKYGIDAKSEESIARARKKATELANEKRISRKS